MQQDLDSAYAALAETQKQLEKLRREHGDSSTNQQSLSHRVVELEQLLAEEKQQNALGQSQIGALKGQIGGINHKLSATQSKNEVSLTLFPRPVLSAQKGNLQSLRAELEQAQRETKKAKDDADIVHFELRELRERQRPLEDRLRVIKGLLF